MIRGKILITAGSILILAAGGLCVYNLAESRRAGESAAETLAVLKSRIPVQTEPAAEPVYPEAYIYTESTAAAEPVQPIEAAGQMYCGYLAIPAPDLTLPVADTLTDAAMKQSPCRYSGSSGTHDLILAAHNYRSQFGRIGHLAADDMLYFTDCAGQETAFRVVQTEQLSGYDIAEMLAGGGTEWQLTLFTCDLSGRSRITVRAAEVKT